MKFFLIILALAQTLVGANRCLTYQEPPMEEMKANNSLFRDAAFARKFCNVKPKDAMKGFAGHNVDTGVRFPHEAEWLEVDDYERNIFNSTAGKFVGAGEEGDIEWLIFMVMPQNKNVTGETLNTIATHFKGKVRVGVVNQQTSERITLAYDMYEQARAFFISKDGTVYGVEKYPYVAMDLITYITNQKYKESPLKYKVPAALN